MTNGGYDDGYRRCPCFWGQEPGSLVKAFISKHSDIIEGLDVLDAGCGEGKNSVAFANAGANVSAVDCSNFAIDNAQRQWPTEGVNWICSDVSRLLFHQNQFDVVILYGLTHCFANIQEVLSLVGRLKNATKVGGYHIYCAFNDRYQELEAHAGFSPLLLSHHQHADLYSDWELSEKSDEDLNEVHPHNNIPHTHSMTRIIARSMK